MKALRWAIVIIVALVLVVIAVGLLLGWIAKSVAH